MKSENKNQRIKKLVERKSTPLDEAEPATCVELTNISITQGRLYREQTILL